MIMLPTHTKTQELLLDVDGGIKIGNTTATNPDPGTIRFTGTSFEGWNGFTWVSLGSFKIAGQVTDYSGNTYPTVSIGSQIWMAENLRVTRYNDGAPMQIINGMIIVNIGATGTLRYPNDQTSNFQDYGGLYNFHCVETGKLCPIGWRVPNNGDWQLLIDFLGGTQVAGLSVKETGFTHWFPNNQGCNDSGFTARGAGRWHETGSAQDFKSLAYLWSSTPAAVNPLFTAVLSSASSMDLFAASSKLRGMSVRCVKN